MKNKELYKTTFSKLHASEKLNLETVPKRGNVFHRPVLVLLTVLCILMIGTTAVLAMSGEGSIRFFNSFFKNTENRLSEDLSSAYVVADGQSIAYDNMNIALEGYYYTEEALLAKVKITSVKGEQEDIREKMKQLRFAVAKLSTSVAVDWETGVSGEDVAVIRTALDPSTEAEREDSAAELLVWNQKQGLNNPIGSFSINVLSEPLTFVPEVTGFSDYSRIEVSPINVRIYFETVGTVEDYCPLRDLAVVMKDGTQYDLYQKENTDKANKIVFGTSFKWSDGTDGFLDIEFSEILEPEDMKALLINGEELLLH